MNTEIQQVATSNQLQTVAATPAAIIQAAIDSKANPETLERLLQIQINWEADEARKAFAHAMVGLKTENLRIQHDRQVGYQGKEGHVGYTHASIGKVCEVLTEAGSRHGFSHSWKTDQTGGMIGVTCVLTHRAGHSESVRMEAQPDNSGKKNSIQQIASTVTYLQRYTVLAAYGATTSIDDDGRGADPEPQGIDPQPYIDQALTTTTSEQALQYWKDNMCVFKRGDKGYEAFKIAVANHRESLKTNQGAQP